MSQLDGIPTREYDKKEGSQLGKSSEADIAGFWSLIDRLYRDRDTILEASNHITKSIVRIDGIERGGALQQGCKGKFDATELKSVLADIQVDINTIISRASGLRPHLKNPALLDLLQSKAHVILIVMSQPDQYLAVQLLQLAAGLRVFAKEANELVLSPTKKSIKVALGIDVGIQEARLKALLEAHRSNY
jgi:hypothetical protein